MNKVKWMFLINLITWTILLITCSYSAEEIKTANVLINQNVTVLYKDKTTRELIAPTGSIIMSPAYFDKLSESMALKDKLLLNANVVRTEANLPRIEKRVYIEPSYIIYHGVNLTIGARVDFVF